MPHPRLLVAGLAAVAFLALQQREKHACVESPPAATSVAEAPEAVELRAAPGSEEDGKQRVASPRPRGKRRQE